MAIATQQDLTEAAEQLARSERGRDALRRLRDWMEEGEVLGLDQNNQDAVLTLLCGAWDGLPGSAREAIHDALRR